MSSPAGAGKRRPGWSRGVVALVALGAVVLLAGSFLADLWPGSLGREVPTTVVQRQDFFEVVIADGNLVAVKAVPVLVPLSAPMPARLAWLADDGSAVAAGEVVVRFDPTDLEKDRRNAQDELAKSRLEESKQRAENTAELAGLEKDAEAARLEKETAEKYSNRDRTLFSQRDIEGSTIDEELARHRLTHAEDSYTTEGKLARIEDEIVRLRQQKSATQLGRAEDGLRALAATAPQAGVLVLERDWRGELPKVGDSVWPGQKIAEIPDPTRLAAEVYVLEADTGGLAGGARAEVVVEADPGRRYPATLERLGTLAQPRIQASPVQYFSAIVQLAEIDPAHMRPGQRVKAYLETKKESGVLVVPRQAIFERDGKMVAYRRQDGRFEPVAVTLGATGLGRVVVTAGLGEGDVIALADPEERPVEIGPKADESGGPASPRRPRRLRARVP